jgi:two-component system response regulator YesN
MIVQTGVDVVFTDIRMAKMDGLSLIRTLRQTGRVNCEFVLISAYQDFDAARAALILGVSGYIVKPFDPVEVEQVARQLLPRLAGRERRLTIPLECTPFIESPPFRAFVSAALTYRYTFAVCCDSFLLLQTEQDGLQCTPVYAEGGVPAYVCSSNVRDTAPFGTLIRSSPGRTGLSRVHEAAPKSAALRLPLVMKEALFALRCEFKYSMNPTAADVQFYLCDHMAEPLAVADIANAFHLSSTYLCTLFKRSTGVTIVRFIQQARMKEALRRIQFTNAKLSDIARAVGYEDYSYFGKVFRQFHNHASPESFRVKAASASFHSTILSASQSFPDASSNPAPF